MPTTTPVITSDELLRRVADGRPGAWAELIARYTPLLRSRAARYRLQEADTLDVMQVTWVRLAENIGRIHTPEHLGGWLATVVSRECQKVGRERRRMVLVEGVGESDAAAEPGPEQRAIDNELAGRMRVAVAALPPRRRDLVLALFADERRPYARIARELGVPIGSLGPTRARTLRELRGMLEATPGTATW